MRYSKGATIVETLLWIVVVAGMVTTTAYFAVRAFDLKNDETLLAETWEMARYIERQISASETVRFTGTLADTLSWVGSEPSWSEVSVDRPYDGIPHAPVFTSAVGRYVPQLDPIVLHVFPGDISSDACVRLLRSLTEDGKRVSVTPLALRPGLGSTRGTTSVPDPTWTRSQYLELPCTQVVSAAGDADQEHYAVNEYHIAWEFLSAP